MENGIRIFNNPRFGEVKMYPASVLDEVFEQSLTMKL
jgi:hypothetical protein